MPKARFVLQAVFEHFSCNLRYCPDTLVYSRVFAQGENGGEQDAEDAPTGKAKTVVLTTSQEAAMKQVRIRPW